MCVQLFLYLSIVQNFDAFMMYDNFVQVNRRCKNDNLPTMYDILAQVNIRCANDIRPFCHIRNVDGGD